MYKFGRKSKERLKGVDVKLVNVLNELITRLNAVSSTKLSVNDFVIKAASLAATKVPETNSSW